jgi:hypothetical protein
MKIEMTYEIAMAVGQDAGNRNMKLHGRTVWNTEDWNVAAGVVKDLLEK